MSLYAAWVLVSLVNKKNDPLFFTTYAQEEIVKEAYFSNP